MIDPKIMNLIEDFGNASFDCGEWRDTTLCAPSYEAVFQASEAAKAALVAAIEELAAKSEPREG